MYINIEIEKKRQEGAFQELSRSPRFNIEMTELLDALENCYTQLGTPYDPIKIDNFVSVGKDAFSLIDTETKVSVSLATDSAVDYSHIIKDYKLVCCKIKIVDKHFINLGKIADSKFWRKIFEYSEGIMCSAPDGTLYISADKDNKCVVSTMKSEKEYNVSYSILLSLKVKFKKLRPRRFYLILDPLVKISSNKDKNPPDTI